MNYRMRIAALPAEINAAAWDALLARQPRPTPFLKHAFLSALTATGCATDETGWAPRFVTLWRDDAVVTTATPPLENEAADGSDADTEHTVSSSEAPPGPGERLVAAAPLYLKSHSYGEYVFDWAWANAYEQHGQAYYPKLLCAVPFTPVSGTRLLAEDDTARFALAQVLVAFAKQSGLSSLHVLYPTEHEANLLDNAGMMARTAVQFHWLNAGYTSFDDFLATLNQKKRKNIRAERRRVEEAGVTFRRVRGEDATPEDWRFFNRCYRHTYREHHSTPYLNLAFFESIAETMPENLLLVIAEKEGRPVASSLLVYDRSIGGTSDVADTDTGAASTRTADAPATTGTTKTTAPRGTLYGRYWGAIEHIDCLHFETAYYQPLSFCIDEGIAVFEGGAQGEHKMARGFLPTVTRSAHWLAHPSFSDAVAHFLARETAGIGNYVDELREHDPFKQRT
ncbi:GNAT family N-acetyltransferase [Robbsia andropogonis]|uniref:GNAT family N-acetyltransferase n=1 Tax=Robbsia andropogonis TaxID=28092 RepID=UPI002A6ACDAA|nr:GNAT family N-acetyltransferase [Robbsia andropogonis]